jgi:hypothetical protein
MCVLLCYKAVFLDMRWVFSLDSRLPPRLSLLHSFVPRYFREALERREAQDARIDAFCGSYRFAQRQKKRFAGTRRSLEDFDATDLL